MTTWRGGDPVATSAAEWDRRAAGFLGCGFRVVVPTGPPGGPAYRFARAQAERVARRLGLELDPVAWAELANRDGGAVVEGGWEYWPGRPFGPPWTCAARLDAATAPEPPVAVAAVSLPWRWGSTGALAGLPTISRLEAARAERHVAGRGAGLGLWFDHRGRLCTTTAGPVVVLAADGRWVRPPEEAGAVTSWTYDEVAAAVAAAPAGLGRAALADARLVCAVGELGDLRAAVSVDGRPCSPDPVALDELRTAVARILSPRRRSGR
ncbi:hypothetical protein [Nocardioides sp. TF02-7]|uniref:hypothetical protein n=1 Tax=Nocardioides sp. TF02-7 TaxID=2917724 RepID=UPI001F060C81|nr:hypothetical protein [Nocardioides sp. TF02-7]UMG92077.1 hypothetical protein MF408_19225 [Nocardioides sp. TF02-7]